MYGWRAKRNLSRISGDMKMNWSRFGALTFASLGLGFAYVESSLYKDGVITFGWFFVGACAVTMVIAFVFASVNIGRRKYGTENVIALIFVLPFVFYFVAAGAKWFAR